MPMQQVATALRSAVLGSPHVSREDRLWQELEQQEADQLALALALSRDAAAVQVRVGRPAREVALPPAHADQLSDVMAELAAAASRAEGARRHAAAAEAAAGAAGDAEADAAAAQRVVRSLDSGHGGAEAAVAADAAVRVARTARAQASAATVAAERAMVDLRLVQARLASLSNAYRSATDTLSYPSHAAAGPSGSRVRASVGSHLPDGSFTCRFGVLAAAEVDFAAENFEQYDVDGDGVISRDDFRAAMLEHDPAWGEPARWARLEAMYRATDVHGDGLVGLDEYLLMRARKRAAEQAHDGEAEGGEALRAALLLSEHEAAAAAQAEEAAFVAAIERSLHDSRASAPGRPPMAPPATGSDDEEDAILAAALAASLEDRVQDAIRRRWAPSLGAARPPVAAGRVAGRGAPGASPRPAANDPFPSPARVTAETGAADRADEGGGIYSSQQSYLRAAERQWLMMEWP